MTDNAILVTGGAGYIGSHVVKLLGEAGENVVVLDDLSTGRRDAVLYGEFVEGDVGDSRLVGELIVRHRVGAVLHFADRTIVAESVADPLKYYGNNTCKTRNLLQCCVDAGVPHFIFSSSASVYGTRDDGRAAEDSPTRPINPYGTSKLIAEWMLRDCAAAYGLGYVALRYFNVAGCDPEGRLGNNTPNATVLIKVAAEVAAGKRDKLRIFGTDYPTADGTGIRDYVHVSDLADAHIKALAYLRRGGDSTVLNVGYGSGYSVRQVVDAMERAAGLPLAVEECPRRPGDPAEVVAVADRIRGLLDWTPRYNDLDFIVRTQLAWEKRG
ncbi:UDP-glucose 4-epimerase GalE [Methylogaea oryzae]|uniref:UDP-glucose 4-epimerase n=1 Tax=Methylogaea oryzae TaxID=1295382 RepID=A0A8D4VMF1_9GAMM|nr:UDP-glucose 4-epimerase GalE [Methylogaea oryzae]BBL70853.1 UDP-glucose 4-epimerase GalE [Methylogaea oryzae]